MASGKAEEPEELSGEAEGRWRTEAWPAGLPEVAPAPGTGLVVDASANGWQPPAPCGRGGFGGDVGSPIGGCTGDARAPALGSRGSTALKQTGTLPPRHRCHPENAFEVHLK